jgi:WD40 repeat protein/DNA-binding SARP family transcriptional activator
MGDTIGLTACSGLAGHGQWLSVEVGEEYLVTQGMDFRVLGPLEAFSERGKVELGGPKPRAVLGVLLLHANEPVSAERLAIALEGENAPPRAPKRVQVHISRLRKALGDGDLLTREPAGYRLRVRPGELDADRFRRLFADGRRALARGQADRAAIVLREALALWRGPPLAELAFNAFEQTEIARLEEEWLAAVGARVDADLALGRHAALVGELRQLVADNPTRERLAGQLMLALYRCGRQAEALEEYREARSRLVEVGVEPGPELRRLQMAILRQDVSLELATEAAELPRELDAATGPPLVGRDVELAWLRERWERARDGEGALVTVTGVLGIGKTRLAAELAGEAHRLGATVLYVDGAGPAEATLAALGHAAETTHPTLVVVDDADQLRADLFTKLGELTRILPTVPVLALASGEREEALERLGGAGAVPLEPLDTKAVGTIATLYARGSSVEEVPADGLLEASGGIPRRVHELASRWGRREAARRVGAVAGRAAAGRAELRSIEAELTGDVVELQAAEERFALGRDERAPVACPFKGLAPFEVSDAEYFFGRERLVAELVARLVGAPLLGVVGPSGSGKSSVVRAGLLPALASGVLPGSEEWMQVLMRPGEHPLEELRSAAAGVGSERKLVLAVDQFEETFTACRDEDERAAFVSELERIPRRDAGAVVLVALRADYYGRCAAYSGLSSLLAANHVLVGSMRHVDLRRAVVGPADRVGLHVEPDLAEALISDVEDEPGALPLLSTALLELWQRRDGLRLRLASYEATGGVRGAVARIAEEAFGRLDETHQALARTVLLRLAEVEPEGGVERRRLSLEELESAGGEGVATVLRLLADARLLTVSAGSVEFAHEALLREWPRLREWIEDDREDLKIHRNLSSAAQEWRRLGRDEDALYRGARLAEARDWAERGDPGPTEPEREFLAASFDRAQRARRVRRRWLTIAFGALALGLVAIAAVAVVAVNQRNDAERQRNIALSRQLALQSENALGDDPELSLQLALWALDTSPTEQAGAALRQATHAFHPYTALAAHSSDTNSAAHSPDGNRVLTGGADGKVVVWDVATGRRVAQLAAGHDEVRAARYAPGGQRIALGFADGTVAVTDESLRAPRVVLSAKGHQVNSVALSGDGERIAAALTDGTVRLLAANGSGPARSLNGHQGEVLDGDISADGSRIVSAGEDGTVRLWSIRDGTGRILHDGSAPETDVAFSPDGSKILGVGRDRRVRLWNAGSGAEEANLGGQGRELEAAAFSADGRRFATGGRDGVTRVWSVGGGPPLAVLRGQRSRVLDVGFGPTSDSVVSVGEDGTVRMWNAGKTQTWTVPSVTYGVEFNRDGRSILGSSKDGTVRVWNPATGQLRASLPGPAGLTVGRFSSAADTILISNGSRVRLWPISAGSAKALVELPEGRVVNHANFDPTGKRIVYVDDMGRVAVRELSSGRQVTLRGTPKTTYAAEVSPDGQHVVVVSERDLLAWRIDRPGGPERALRGHRGPVQALDFSQDGRLVSAGSDHTVRVWDRAGRATAVMRGFEDELSGALFTDDGAQVLSASQDGTLRLLDASTGAVLATLNSPEGELYGVALSRDGKIATLGKGEVVRVFPCDFCGSLERVRALALSRSPRPLTGAERRQFLAAAK